MSLDERLRENEELTEALRQAVVAGDEPACGPLLERRGRALTALDEALRALGPAQRIALQPRLLALAAADAALRTAAGTALAQSGEAFRAQCGTAGRGPAAADRAPEPACLDRRA